MPGIPGRPGAPVSTWSDFMTRSEEQFAAFLSDLDDACRGPGPSGDTGPRPAAGYGVRVVTRVDQLPSAARVPPQVVSRLYSANVHECAMYSLAKYSFPLLTAAAP